MRFVLLLLALVLTFSIISHGFTASERAECLEWQAQSAEYPAWFSTSWQRDQCKAHGLDLPR